MLETSETWKELWKDPLVEVETRLDIAGVEYTHADFSDSMPKTTGGMFDELGIGNCASRQLTAVVIPKSEIPRQAEMRLYVRLVKAAVHDVDGTEKEAAKESEWLPQGVFYISTRETNKVTGALTIHGFDAMRKAGEPWLSEGEDLGSWPKTESEAVESIAAKMGVEIDARTEPDNIFPVDYPVDESGDMAMADVLSGIAAANAGNWIITEKGELRLIKLNADYVPEVSVLGTENGEMIDFGGVILLVG